MLADETSLQGGGPAVDRFSLLLRASSLAAAASSPSKCSDRRDLFARRRQRIDSREGHRKMSNTPPPQMSKTPPPPLPSLAASSFRFNLDSPGMSRRFSLPSMRQDPGAHAKSKTAPPGLSIHTVADSAEPCADEVGHDRHLSKQHAIRSRSVDEMERDAKRAREREPDAEEHVLHKRRRHDEQAHHQFASHPSHAASITLAQRREALPSTVTERLTIGTGRQDEPASPAPHPQDSQSHVTRSAPPYKWTFDENGFFRRESFDIPGEMHKPIMYPGLASQGSGSGNALALNNMSASNSRVPPRSPVVASQPPSSQTGLLTKLIAWHDTPSPPWVRTVPTCGR